MWQIETSHHFYHTKWSHLNITTLKTCINCLLYMFSALLQDRCCQHQPLKRSTRWTLQPDWCPAGTWRWSWRHACFMSISFLCVSRQSFQLLYVCVCVLSAPPGTRTTVSVPFLGELYYQGCVMASCYFPLFTVDAVCHWGISLAHRHAGCCGLPDPVMKAFRCLETYHFPQLCIPKLHSDETCLYHSHDNLDISVISTWKHKLYFLSMCKFEGQLLWRENPT